MIVIPSKSYQKLYLKKELLKKKKVRKNSIRLLIFSKTLQRLISTNMRQKETSQIVIFTSRNMQTQFYTTKRSNKTREFLNVLNYKKKVAIQLSQLKKKLNFIRKQVFMRRQKKFLLLKLSASSATTSIALRLKLLIRKFLRLKMKSNPFQILKISLKFLLFFNSRSKKIFQKSLLINDLFNTQYINLYAFKFYILL